MSCESVRESVESLPGNSSEGLKCWRFGSKGGTLKFTNLGIRTNRIGERGDTLRNLASNRSEYKLSTSAMSWYMRYRGELRFGLYLQIIRISLRTIIIENRTDNHIYSSVNCTIVNGVAIASSNHLNEQ